MVEKKRILSEIEHLKLLDDMIVFLLEGYTFSDISEYYERKNGYNNYFLWNYWNKAKQEIEKRADVDIETVIHTHLAMYDEAWKFFENTENQTGKNRALYLKEKLLNLYPEESIIEINNVANYNFEKENEYDITRLTEEEKKKLNYYFKKMEG